ncbi:MAG: hypothetical protein E6929_11705 [Clostridium sp.]|nr:hypothetical protein [Clostridium sp.]
METIAIVNVRQAGMYIKNGVKPIDVYFGKDRLVFLFNKKDTREVYDKWCKYELN